jgi:hypothetical protein
MATAAGSATIVAFPNVAGGDAAGTIYGALIGVEASHSA